MTEITRPPSPAAAAGIAGLQVVAPPPDLAGQVIRFVHRIDPDCGGVVRILPEVRTSIQVMAADPYWIREQDPAADWRELDRVALWGPRHDWGWGFARRRIVAYALALTPAGFASLTGGRAEPWVNRVQPLSQVQPDLAHAMDARADEAFEAWVERVGGHLRAWFAVHPSQADPTQAGLDRLAREEGDATAQAARACGLSTRHHRRVFRQLHGTTPKAYQRLLRVDRMIRRLHDSPWECDDWSEAPLPFSDQPHAVREFRAATGMTPEAYRRAKRNGDATLRSVFMKAGPPPPV